MYYTVLISLIFLTFVSKAQFLENPNCPIGTRFDGYFCINDYQYKNCPQDQFYDSVRGQCISRNFTSCNHGYELRENEYGQSECVKLVLKDQRAYGDLSETDKDQKDVTLLSICQSSHSKAKRACTTAEQASGVAQMARNFEMYRNSGNIKDACQAARSVASKSVGTNIAFAYSCKNAVSNCLNSCSSPDESVNNMRSQCEDLRKNSQLGIDQAAEDARIFAGSSACEVAVNANCQGNPAYQNPECAQYCTLPKNKTASRCQTVQTSCQNPQFLQQHLAMCGCLQNPQSCNKFQASFGADSLALKIQNIPNTISAFDNNDFMGNESQGSLKVQVEGSNARSGGGSNWNGGLDNSQNQNLNPSTNAKNSQSANIAHESNSPNAYGSASGSKGYNPSPANSTSANNAYESARFKEKIDLTQFIPNPKEPEYLLRLKGFGPGVPSLKEQQIAYTQQQMEEVEKRIQERKLASQKNLDTSSFYFPFKLSFKNILFSFFLILLAIAGYVVHKKMD